MSDERKAKVTHDVVNEQVVLAASIADKGVRERLVRDVRADHFLLPQHAVAWRAIAEIVHRKLDFEVSTVERLAGERLDVAYLQRLAQARPTVPKNLQWHVDGMRWDHQRVVASRGPVNALLEALADSRAEPEKVRSLSRTVAAAFDGAGAGAELLDPGELVAEQMVDLRRRAQGHACYPFGVDGLDVHEDGQRRLIPGAAPGQVTVITGTSGSGKSTFAAHLALGLKDQGRRVCYGAWEVRGGMTLEILACIELGWSRTGLMTGAYSSREELVAIEEKMHELSKSVTFMRNPFRKRVRERVQNQHNLDVVQENLAASGADVFIADLWLRCLRDVAPDEEQEALFRQQAMAEEMGVHCVLVHQQRMKEVEGRADKRPTREGAKGSSAWVEIADTMIGVYRPALWKRMDDNTLEAFVLKQRYGKWPLGVEFEWDGDLGSIRGGKSIPYEQPGEAGGDGFFGDGPVMKNPRGQGKRR